MSTTNRYCSNCGNQAGDGRFCSNCGHARTGNTAPGDAGASGEPNQTQAPDWWHLSGPLEENTVIREYKITRLLGEGGMGEVYEGEHQLTSQRVAIKVVAPELMRDETTRKRFLEEARVMASLDHQNIVTLHNFFEEGGRFFLVMEFIDGGTLEGLLEAGRMKIPQAIQIMKGVLEALEIAHNQTPAIVHRDIKPANIMLTKEGRIVLTDFGIAKALGREKLTRTRGVVGTYEYMSPEQIQGGSIDARSDLYSAGIVLYQMLAGVVPFPQKSETGIECMNAHLGDAPPHLSEYAEGATEFQSVLDKALSKEVATRYQSAADMRTDLHGPHPSKTEGGASSIQPAHPAPEYPAAPPEPAHTPDTPTPNPFPTKWIIAGVLSLLAVALVVALASGFGSKSGDADQHINKSSLAKAEKPEETNNRQKAASDKADPYPPQSSAAEEQRRAEREQLRLQQEQLANDRAEAERLAEQARSEAHQLEVEKLRLEKQRQEAQLQRARAEAAAAKAEAEAARAEREREAARAERDRQAAARAEQARQEAARLAAQALPTLPSGKTMAIQASDPSSWQKGILSGLRQEFVNTNWNKIFPLDYNVDPEGNQVRYYYQEDSWTASKVRDFTQSYLSDRGIHVNISLRPMLDFRPKPRNSGLIEIWLQF